MVIPSAFAAFLQKHHGLFGIWSFCADAAAEGGIALYCIKIIAVKANAAHIGQRVAIAAGDAYDQTVGDGKHFGFYAVCGENALYTFLDTICFSATDAQLLAYVCGEI